MAIIETLTDFSAKLIKDYGIAGDITIILPKHAMLNLASDLHVRILYPDLKHSYYKENKKLIFYCPNGKILIEEQK